MTRKAAVRLMLLAAIFLGAGFWAPLGRAECPKLSNGQTVYVAAYTNVFTGAKSHEFPLAATLVVHNVDPGQAVTVRYIKHYGSQGQLLQEYLPNPISLPPLGSRRFLVQGKDPKQVEQGACFLLAWKAARPVNPPLVECLMIGTTGQQGISFTTQGVVIQPEK